MLKACLLQLVFVQPVLANFTNGGFEDIYTPSNADTHNPINGWTLTGYTFGGNLSSAIPTSIADINLVSPTIPGGITDIVNGATETIEDYFLLGAPSAPTLRLPVSEAQSVMINLRSVNQPFALSRSSSLPSGWGAAGRAFQATAISQQMVVQAADVDPADGKVHIRFKAAPVLQDGGHPVEQQPFFAVQVNNITTGRTNANPIFFQWNFAAQPGVPWKSLASGAGSNSGSSTLYSFSDWQAFDIAPGNAFIRVGDTIELVAIASGCAAGGHEAHLYLDDVQTTLPSGLWVSAAGPTSSTPGNDITYTYTYTNEGSTAVNNVQVVANLPQQGTPSSPSAESVTFVSVTTPTAGVSPTCTGTGPVTCSIGTLQPGQTGTFIMTVNIPNTWATSTGPVNNGNYPISGQGVSPLLGPLVQTNLVPPSGLSNLLVNTTGLPSTANVGVPYTGTFTCTNTSTASATGDAGSASCDITGLPVGLGVSACAISPSGTTWNQPDTIPANQTVTCTVSGTPSTTGAVTATAVANAANNSNSTGNQANAPINVQGLADLAVTTSINNANPTVGGQVTFTVTTRNLGPSSASGVSVQSLLPSGYTLVSATPSVGSYSNGVWTIDSLANQAEATLNLVAVLNSSGAYTFNAAVANQATDTNSANNSASDTIHPQIPATLNGSRLINSGAVCCGRPVLLGNLPVGGTGPTSFAVTAHTGKASCVIRKSGKKTYLKMHGRGSCTVIGTKGGITSAPFTVRAL